MEGEKYTGVLPCVALRSGELAEKHIDGLHKVELGTEGDGMGKELEVPE